MGGVAAPCAPWKNEATHALWTAPCVFWAVLQETGADLPFGPRHLGGFCSVMPATHDKTPGQFCGIPAKQAFVPTKPPRTLIGRQRVPTGASGRPGSGHLGDVALTVRIDSSVR